MTQFRMVAPVVLVVAAAACFEPAVENWWEPPADAGADGGLPPVLRDAGLDGGVDGGRECTTFRDCAAPDAGPLDFCSAQSASCIEGRCVTECFTQRTCEVSDDSQCLICTEPSSTTCTHCGARNPCTMTISTAGCPAPFVQGASFALANAPSLQCGMSLTPADGGTSVALWYPLTGGNAVALIPELGGWCTANGLFTGLPRMAVTCPKCAFVEVGCE